MRWKWNDYLWLGVGVLALGLMGWGLFEGASLLVRTLRPVPPGDTSIALSAGFVPPGATAVEPVDVEATKPSLVPEKAVQAEGVANAANAADASGKVETATKVTESKEKPQVFEIRGSVQRAGRPISSGKVRLTVSLVGERFRQSTLVDLDSKGEFLIHNNPAFQILKPKNRIRVLAEVWPAVGTVPGRTESITETIYLNHNLPSWLRSSTGYGILAGVSFLAVFFLWAFTGHSTYGKNRLAIILSYSVIFLSLAGALVGPTLLMLAVPDLPEISGKVPVGLVVARLTKEAKPEWMLNLGGYVDTGEPVMGDGEDISLAAPTLRVVTLNGGIQIPLYVILLALIGGAINMTRQVPDFQSRQPVQSSMFDRFRPGSAAKPPVQQNDIERENGWRKGLLEQYMFLIAAPFLAIATYYLLILLGTIQPPIIVLVCFSIGLISDTVVTSITRAAKKLLGGEEVKPDKPGQPTSEIPEPAMGPQPVPDAAGTVQEEENVAA